MNDQPWLSHYDPGVPHRLEYRAMPVHQFLRDSARSFPEHACTIFNGHSITYQEMDRLSNVLAAALVDMGLQKGDRVGLLIPNLPQYVLVFYAVLKAGGVVAALNPAYKPREVDFHLTDSGVHFVFCMTPLLDVVKASSAASGLARIIHTGLEDESRLVDALSISGTAPQGKVLPLLDVLAGYSAQPAPQVDVSAEDVAIFQYSGGTTGTPKGALGLHRNLTANTQQFRAWLVGLNEGDEAVLAAIPLFHVYGMVIAMSLGVYLGAALVLIPDARDIVNILNHIDRYHTTLFPGVPNLYNAINNHPDVSAGKYNLRSIKACISGSAPLLRETKERFEALTGGHLIEGYGLSEAPTATHCNPMFGVNKTGSIGLPLPDVDCALLDVATGEVFRQPDRDGELLIRGPQIMAGYHNMPEETADTLRDGWLHTGDIARVDEEGYFYLVDRKKDLIKVGGFQVWPREIEEVIAAHPAVKEVGVAGVPHPTRVEVVKAWVVLREGQSLGVEDVRAWCREALVGYKVPAEVEFVDALPRTGVGKLLRRELVRRHVEIQSGGVHSD